MLATSHAAPARIATAFGARRDEPAAVFAAFVARMAEVLRDEAVSRPLLEGRWADEWAPSNPTAGHCCTAAEALYFAMGGPRAGLVAWSASYDDGGERATHWWLRGGGAVWDPTRAQYDHAGELPPYERVAADPSFRARIAPGGFQGQRRLAPGAPDPWGFGRRPGRRAALLLARMGITAARPAIRTEAVQ